MRPFSVALLASASLSLAALGAPAASPTPAAEDFLILPSKELLREGAEAPLKVGDRIRLKVEGVEKDSAAVALPPLLDAEKLREEGFAIVESGKGSKPFQFEIVPILPGERSLPSLAIVDTAASPPAAFARTNPLPLKIESSISKYDPKPQEAVPAKEPVSLPFPPELIALLTTVALAILGTVVFLAAKWLAIRAAKAVRAALPRKPEDVEALDRLSEIEKNQLAKKGQYKKHYFGVSETLKTYIGRRWAFDAPERTSDEIIRHLRERALVADLLVSRLRDLFERLDLIKFTDTIPAQADAESVLRDARAWVSETRRPPEPPKGAKNALR